MAIFSGFEKTFPHQHEITAYLFKQFFHNQHPKYPATGNFRDGFHRQNRRGEQPGSLIRLLLHLLVIDIIADVPVHFFCAEAVCRTVTSPSGFGRLLRPKPVPHI